MSTGIVIMAACAVAFVTTLACSTREIEVTRIVDRPIEVTRQVTVVVEVTRQVLVTPRHTRTPTPTPDVRLCQLHRKRSTIIDAILAERNVETNQKRLTEVTLEMADFVETHGMAGRITPLELMTDTGMEAWCNSR